MICSKMMRIKNSMNNSILSSRQEFLAITTVVTIEAATQYVIYNPKNFHKTFPPPCFKQQNEKRKAKRCGK